MEWDSQNTIHPEGSYIMLRHGVGREQGEEVADLLQSFIGPLEQWLDRQTDRRLVRTFFLALVAIVRLRHSRSGLLLSELGAHILSPAPAGTKRLSNLLRSSKWSHTLLDEFLRHRAEQSLSHLEQRDELALAIWDESVLEKPESIALEGLCPVRSSKAARVKRIKPGYYNLPGGPLVFLPGLQWLTVMLAGMQGTPSLAAMGLWTRRGQLGQPPPGADRIPALSVRPVVARVGGPRLRPGIRRRSLAQGTGRTSTAVHPALAHPLPPGR